MEDAVAGYRVAGVRCYGASRRTAIGRAVGVLGRVVIGLRPPLFGHHAVTAGPAVALVGLIRFPRAERSLVARLGTGFLPRRTLLLRRRTLLLRRRT
jgi:hypothetical protein